MKEEITNTKKSVCDEARLLAMLSHDSEFAFQVLFDQHKNHVYKVACLYTKSTDTAEEILQEVFMKVWTHRKNLGEIKSFEAWLYTVTKNAILNYNKRLAAEWKMYKSYTQQNRTTENDTDHKICDAQFQKLLQEIITQLSPKQQLIYKLAKEESLSYKQIADLLSISPLTVKTHLASALRTIRNNLRHHNKEFLILFLISTAVM